MPLRRLLVASLIILSLSVADLVAQAPQCVTAKGVFLAQKGEGAWEPIKAGAAVPLERSLVSLFETNVLSANGAVEVRLLGEIGELGPLPAFEAAVKFHDNPKVDLALTLERGIALLVNKKKEGAANVALRIRGKTLAITLREPETRLGINLYARHAPGLEALKADEPTYFVVMLNLDGSTQVHYLDKEVSLKAPPGPALLRFDSAFHDVHVQHLDKLPEWAVPTADNLKAYARINDAAKNLGGANASAAFLKLLFSEDPIDRKVGLTAVGALGNPGPLFVALQQSKHADTRQFAIQVIRNWLGHDAGQLKKLEAASEKLGMTKTNTESLLHLLLGFDGEERQQPGTYQLLIEGLHHSKMLVRELSYWHLVRMAPAGRGIAYDPAGTPEQIRAGVGQWRELIPPGQMPPAPKKSAGC